MTFLPLALATIIVAYLNIGVAAAKDCEKFCMTPAECEAQYNSYFKQFGGYSYDETNVGQDFDIPPAGCFMKNFNVFYIEGEDDEKMNMNLPGIRERVCCDPMETYSNQLKVSPDELKVSASNVVASSASNVGNPKILGSLLVIGAMNLMF